VSPSGVRSRGLTIAAAPRAVVRAPAAGRIAYARPFLGYGTVVIIDHGGGWTSLISGLERASVAAGADVEAGARIGRGRGGDDPRVTVELRRRGRPVDLVALLG
jgi:septal ring factor EnvC (AmiA/AmiB activator)